MGQWPGWSRSADRCSDRPIDGILEQNDFDFQQADPLSHDLGTGRKRTMATATALMTWEEFLALPDDGTERDLIRGELRTRTMTRRNRNHSRTEAGIARMLGNWLESRPAGSGEIVSGEAGFRLSRDPDLGVGIDVAYVGPEVAGASKDSAYFEGPPILAVEILSPSDKQEEIDEKILLYLETGVGVVWIVNTRLKTVNVYRPDADPVLFHKGQIIDAEPHLPGFLAAVKDFF
jgi:Uma2 family endonuclease